MQASDVVAIAWKRRLLILGVLVLTVGLGAAFAFTQPAKYEATATIALTPDVRRGQGFVASDSISALVNTYAETAKAEVVRRRAASELGRPLPGEIETSTEAGTGILRIIGRSTDPRDAAVVAGAVARAFRESIAGNRLVVATLVDPAEPPTSPVQPRPPLIIGVAALLGLLAALVLAVAIERLRRRVETPADVAELTDAPVIARLPRQRSLQRGGARLIWESDRMTALQESYRALRTNVQFLVADRPQLIQVTSPAPEQGKSTIVANLAVALGQAGIDTVVVDADLRRPQQHVVFDVDNATGLSTLMLERDPDVEAAFRPTGQPGVWLLPSGPPPPDPSEMLHIRFPSVVRALRAHPALVLIDCPPLNPVTDARQITPHVDGVVLVMAAGETRPADAEQALERLEFIDASLLGIVLNAAGQDVGGGGGHYYQRPARPAAPVEPA